MSNSTPDPQEQRRLNERQNHRRAVKKRTRSLQIQSFKGLFVLVLFLMISIAAINEFRMFPSLSPEIRDFLGAAPPPDLISIALLLYFISALILTFARLATASLAHGGFTHLGYLTGFYLFYHFAHRLADHFWAVFFTGITVIGLESYHIYLSFSEAALREEDEVDSFRND